MSQKDKRAGYAGISSLKELRACRADIDRRLENVSGKLSGQYEYLKIFYTPANLFNRFIDSISPIINFVGVLSEVWKRVRDGFSKRRAAQPQNQADNQEASTEQPTESCQ